MSNTESNKSASRENPSSEAPILDLRTWKDYYLIIRERLFFGAAVALLVSGAVGYVLLRQPPVYASTASLMLDNQREHVLDMPQVVESGLAGDRHMWRISLENHIKQLTSRGFRDYVIDSFTEEEKEQLVSAYRHDDPRPSIGHLVRDVTAESVPDTFILRIEANHRDPNSAALIAGRYVERYLEFNRERTQSGNEDAIGFLTEREEELREKTDQAEENLQNYRKQHNLVSIEENQTLLAIRLAAVNSSLTEARMARIEVEGNVRQVESFLREDKNLLEIFSLSSLGSTPEAVSQLDRLVNEREVMSEKYGARHPEMIANERAIGAAERQIRQNLDLAVADLRNQLSHATEYERDLTAVLKELEEESIQLDRLKIQYASLQRTITASRNTHAQVLDRLDETLITSQMTNSSIRVFDRASVPGSPVEPNLMRIGMLVVFLGGFFFFGTPLGLAALDNKLKHARDVEGFLEQRLLGEISSVGSLKRTARAHVVSDDSDDRAVEGFRGLFTQLQLTSKTGYPKVFMVTSTVPGEGKSFIVNNLACSFAAHGKRTLMVDFDLRRPSLHRIHSRLNEAGLLQWLGSADSLTRNPTRKDLNIAEIRQNLCLLSSGGQTKKATEIIGLPAVERMIAALKNEFDVVLIDTPPLGVFPDPLPLARLVDESVFVVHFGKVDREQVKTSVKQLTDAEANLLGVVMNSMPKGARFSHYYSGYGFGSSKYARYYAQAEA